MARFRNRAQARFMDLEATAVLMAWITRMHAMKKMRTCENSKEVRTVPCLTTPDCERKKWRDGRFHGIGKEEEEETAWHVV